MQTIQHIEIVSWGKDLAKAQDKINKRIEELSSDYVVLQSFTDGSDRRGTRYTVLICGQPLVVDGGTNER